MSTILIYLYVRLFTLYEASRISGFADLDPAKQTGIKRSRNPLKPKKYRMNLFVRQWAQTACFFSMDLAINRNFRSVRG